MGQDTSTSTFYVFRANTFRAVDAEKGILSGVAVITEGAAKGHTDFVSGKPMYVDATTLLQVKACAETYMGGLKVKMDHFSGITEIVGALREFSADGQILRADLQLLNSTKHRDYVLEIAQTIPDAFGLSIAFSGPAEVIGDRAFARCTEIYSADLVSEPAANPSGLFSAKSAEHPGDKPGKHQPNQKMSADKQEGQDPLAAMASTISALSERLSKLEADIPVAGDEEKKKDDSEAMNAKMEQVAELSAINALKKFSATFGTPPAPPSHEGKQPSPPDAKTFESIVRAHSAYSTNKPLAIRETVAKYGKEHGEYMHRVRAGGDVIVF